MPARTSFHGSIQSYTERGYQVDVMAQRDLHFIYLASQRTMCFLVPLHGGKAICRQICITGHKLIVAKQPAIALQCLPVTFSSSQPLRAIIIQQDDVNCNSITIKISMVRTLDCSVVAISVLHELCNVLPRTNSHRQNP